MAPTEVVAVDLNSTSTPKIVYFTADPVQKVLRISGAVVATTAFLISSLTLIVLLRRYKTRGVRLRCGIGSRATETADLSMILLQVSEVCFTSSAALFFSVDTHLSNKGSSAHSTLMNFCVILYYPTAVFLGLRNLWITVLTLCRCFAVMKPIAARRCLTKLRVTFLFLICIVISFLNSLYLLLKILHSTHVKRDPIYLFSRDLTIAMIANAVIKTLLPIVIVFIASVMIAWKLSQDSWAKELPVPAPDVTVRGRRTFLSSSSSRRNHKRRNSGTKVVLCIAVCFLLFESFGIIYKLVHLSHEGGLIPPPEGHHDGPKRVGFQQMAKINDILVALDSLANFIILFALSKSFRDNLKSGSAQSKSKKFLSWSSVQEAAQNQDGLYFYNESNTDEQLEQQRVQSNVISQLTELDSLELEPSKNNKTEQ